MAEKKTWYFHGAVDQTWNDTGNWTANHVYNSGDPHPSYVPWTNQNDYPDADLRAGSVYTGDIYLDCTVGVSESFWNGTYGATTFIGVEKLGVTIIMDTNSAIYGGIWTSTIIGNNQLDITGGIFFGTIMDDGNGGGIAVGYTGSPYNPWLPVFYGTVTCGDNSSWYNGIFLGDVVNNNPIADSVLRGSVDGSSLTNCAVYKPSSITFYSYDGYTGTLTNTVFMRNFSSTTDTRQFSGDGVLMKECVFMQPLTQTQLANAELGDCYFHDAVNIPASCKVVGGLFKKQATINGSVGINPSAYNQYIHPPIFCNALVASNVVSVTSVSIASPAVFTATAHGLASGMVIDTPNDRTTYVFYGRNTITKLTEDTFSIPVSNLPAGTFTITYGGNTTSSLNIATSTTAQVQTALRAITGFGSCTVTGTSWVGNVNSSATYTIDVVAVGAVTLPTLTKSMTVGNIAITSSRTGTTSVSAKFNLTRSVVGVGIGFTASVVNELENSFFTQTISLTSQTTESASSTFSSLSATSRTARGYSGTNGSLNMSLKISGTAAVVGFSEVTLGGPITGGYIAGIGASVTGAISGGLFAVNSLTTSGGISGSTAKFMGSVLTNSGTITGGVIFSTGIVNTGTLSNGCTVYGTFTTKGTNAAKMPIDQIGVE